MATEDKVADTEENSVAEVQSESEESADINMESETDAPTGSAGEEEPETDSADEISMTADKEETQSEEDAFSDGSTADAQSEGAEEEARVSEASKLVLSEKEEKTLDLTTDTEYSGIELASGSILSVDTNGHSFNVTGDITGTGKLVLRGNNIKVQNISVSDLVFDTATVNASGSDSTKENTHEITAAESLTIQNSEISNAAFLGYGKNVSGNRTLTFGGSGNNLYNIDLVGVYPAANTNVLISGVSLITTSTNTSFCYDNKIIYKYQDKELSAGSEWPVSYRSAYSGNTADAKVTGYHISGTEEVTGTFVPAVEGGIVLPEYAEDGYVYNGWMLGESQGAVKNLPQKLSGDITLNASMTASELTVTTDLGYEPSEDTNDNYQDLKKEESQSSTWGETITLSTPSRFGYTFAGWKVIKENGDAQDQAAYTDSYTTSLQDAATTENGSYIIRLKAQWTAKSFPFRLFIKDADVARMQVKIGNQSYESVQAFATDHADITWNSQTSQLELPDIQYGESLHSYLQGIGISEVPSLVDTRDALLKKDFEGWTTPGGNLLTEDEDIYFVLGGILDNHAESISLADYEKSISSTPLFLTSIWEDTEYKLTVKNAGGWEVLVNGEVQTLDETGNAVLAVQVGNSVTFRCSSGNPANFSLWYFSDGFVPEETEYSSGAKYISYTTVMPYHDVSAVYNNPANIYIDIEQSAITFEENVNLSSGRTVDGFWYDKKMEESVYDGMDVNAMTPAFQAENNDTKHPGKYFYIWDSKDTFHVTSCKEETKNQLTLVNSMTVALKECKLAATDAYKKDAVNRKLSGILLEGTSSASLQTELSKIDLCQYGNIILDVAVHQKYTTQIKLEGENAVGVIVQSRFDASSAYNGTLNISGTTGKTTDKLTISGTLLNETVNFESLTLLQDESVSSDYLLYCSATNEGVGNITFAGCDIQAEKKRIHTYRGNLTFKQSSKKEDSSMNIGGARTYGPSNVRNNSYIRCFGDWLGTYNTFYMYDDASIVIDGNLLTTYSHWTAGAIVQTSGYLIVKGNRAELENLAMTKGTVIVNAAVLGRSCTVTGGTLIANQLMNSPEKYAGTDNDGNYVYTGTSNCAPLQENDDNYPFITYSQNNQKKGEFLFGGTSKIYLLGYYQTSKDKVYDTSLKATDSNNPVAEVLGKVIAESGNLDISAALSDTELKSLVENSKYTHNECAIFGNSTYHTAARMRSVLVSGGEIYAAGNLTFFNDTEITAGSIYCNGRLSGKRDLSISGTANVTAEEIGNNYNLTTSDDSGITRWQKMTVSGGTITTDRLGAVSEPYVPESSVVSRSTLIISGNPIIQARTAKTTVEYATDIYLNYLADEDTFTLPGNLPSSVHYDGNDYQNLRMDQAVTLQAPTLKTGTGTANWALDSLTGESVDTIKPNAEFSLQDKVLADKNVYKGRDKICFYAVKGTYDLSVAEGKDQISQIQIGDSEYTNFDSAISANRAAEVTITLKDTSMAGRSVIWYQDAAGKFYNVDPTEKNENGQVILKFTMPAASVQIYVTDEMKLYLNRYEISITSDGFRTQYDTETDGKKECSFTYAGNLIITQDNIKDTVLVSNGTIGVNGILKNQTNADSTQLTGATKNRLHIESVNEKRSVTLNKLIMDGGQDEDKIIVEENCGDVELQIDGAVRVLSTYLQTGSNLTWKGKNQKAVGETDQDILQFDSGTSGTANSTGFVHSGNNGETGNVAFDHLNIIRSKQYYAAGLSARRPLVYSSAQKPSAEVSFKNCNMAATVESSMSLICNYPNVVIEDSDFNIKAATAWNSVFFSGCDTVTIRGGSLSYTSGAAYDAYPLYYGVKNFCIDGAKVSLSNANSENDTYRMLQPDNMIPNEFTVKNAGELNVDHRIKLKKLTLSSDGNAVPEVNIGKTETGTYEGSLLCKSITVEKGEIHTGRLLISGYYNAPYTALDYMSKTEILTQLRAENHLEKNGTLTLKDGIIEAAEEIGGALGGTITVEGGEITSPAIGSCDKLYGYGQYLPTKDENEWIYSISRIPEQFSVQVKGGTVNVPAGGYLGGMNTSVIIADGKVNLLGNAVFGMNESQKKQLTDHYSSKGDDIAKHTDTNCLVTVSGGCIEQKDSGSDTASGSILAPYGKVRIETAKVKVANILADRGSVQISKTNMGYTNPYSGSETGQYKKENIGVWVLDTISAETLEITDGAQVYAENAYAVVRKSGNEYQGSLKVTESGLYAASYGEKGVSRTEEGKNYNDKSQDNAQTVFGTRLVSVTYVLNPQNVISESDLTTVINESPTSYSVTSSDIGTDLIDAQCRGYNFLGWYTDSDCLGNKAEKLNTTIANDVTLYAKWEKIKVTFQVMMDKGSTGSYSETEFTGNTNWKQNQNGDSYVSVKTVELFYGDRILTTDGVNLMDYTTNTLGITELEIQEADCSGLKAINAETIVSKDLAEFYKTKAASDKNAVLTLHVKNVQKRIASVTFSVNRKNGKPVDASFDNGNVQIFANIGVDKKIGEVSGFGDTSVTDGNSKGLVKPKATGYTFVGWNVDASATKDTADGWVTAENVFKHDTTVYAIWQVNTYLIEFNAGNGSWVTSNDTAPAVGTSEVKTLSYYWIYDTPVSEDHSFWLKDTENDKYMTEMPYAWREGYVFDHNNGWTYSYTNDNENSVTDIVYSTEELSKLAVKALQTAAGDPNGNPTQVALTITASYTPVTVTYHRNGGEWTSESAAKDQVSPAYGTSLAGYVKENADDVSQNNGESSAEAASDFRKLAEMTGENNSKYYVADTTSGYFDEKKDYVENDYRNSLARKGYTFYGWYETQKDADAAIAESNTEGTNTVISVGTAPRFRNVDLYAAWKPNSYTLKIKNKDDSKNYEYTTFGVLSNTTDSDTANSEITDSAEEAIADVTVNVTTGQEIRSDEWPTRDSSKAWYVKDKNDDAGTTKRYFLGATFAALNPGAKTIELGGKDTYDNYVKALTRLEEKNVLYQKGTNDLEGTMFKLPDNNSYSNAITGNDGDGSYIVPDYPEGCTIPMYAVYREQSIVFVERYIDKNGVLQEKIKHTADWSTWSEYTTKNYSGTEIEFDGYTLVGWYVNSTEADETKRYPKEDLSYKANLKTYQDEAAKNGTYDIIVYTVYAPKITRDVQLKAQSDPTSTEHFANTYTLPGSMQKGILSMNLSGKSDKLHVVSKDEMQNHEYDLTWNGENGITYTSDTTIAVEVAVNGTGISSTTKNLSEQSDGILGFENLEIGAGDQITLTLYHSRVMTAEKEYTFNLNAGFTRNDGSGHNTLENQLIENNITVNLTPSVYTVDYQLQLPEELSKLKVLESDGKENWGDFSKPQEQDAEVVEKQVKAGYGSALLMNFPEVEGYTKNEGWKVSENTDKSSGLYKELTMKVSAENNGIINISSGYTVQTYELSADANVLFHWNITYSDGPDSTSTTVSELSTDSAGHSATVKYHSVIRFEPKDSSKVDPAEFVTLTLSNSSVSSNDSVSFKTKLPDYASTENDNYTFTMPAQNVEGSYITTETLYLEDGTISITENSYTQTKTAGEVNKTWRGDYQILQNAQNNASKATENTLILANDLSGRNILLGNLNISSDNSIELKAENSESNATKATLTMNTGNEITAKNIQVPAACELTVNGTVTIAADSSDTISNTLNLEPSNTNAAVGGTSDKAANGKITLQDLNLNLSMPAGSKASGIGPSSRDTKGAGNIELDDCSITVAEGSTTEVYQGVWIGGDNTSEVTLNKVSLNTGNEKHMAGPAITAGKVVSIKGSKIGTTDNNVSDPVYAVDTLNIENSEIHMNIQDNISTQAVNVPIGTLNENGKTTIKNSAIKVVKAGQGAFSDIYSGIIKIEDSASNVLIDGTQLVEISNGSINLDGTAYTQNDKNYETDASRKNYRLLEEGTASTTAPDLTVKVLPENGHVEIQQPLSEEHTAVEIGNLTIWQSAEFILNGNLNVNGEALIQTESTNSSDSTGSPITVTVTADKTEEDNSEDNSEGTSAYGISYKSSGQMVFAKANGSTYVQNGGSLSSDADFSDGSLNVTLNNVTAAVSNLYADELIIDGGSVAAGATEESTSAAAETTKSAVGSKPAENGVSVVTIKNASVTADLIGALGTYDQTFTTVKTENAKLNGKLVQDHYRLTYDTGKADLETTSLNHTVRTEKQLPADSGTDSSTGSESAVTVFPENGIPGKPTGTGSELFGCWYINNTEGIRQALASGRDKLLAGLTESTILSESTLENAKIDDVTDNKDCTKTLTVHAWLNATGTVTIKSGRIFQSFNDEAKSVSVQSNGAWTAQLVSTGTAIEGRDYQVSFGSALPKGTTLTLTEPATGNTAGKYYWYKVNAEMVSSVKFTDFTAMGGTDKFKSVTQTENIPENETFLLSAEFPKTSESTVTDQKVTFELLPSETEGMKEAVAMGEEVTYTLISASQGNVSVSGQNIQTVTINKLPQDADRLTGQNLFMKAVISRTDPSETLSMTSTTVPYNTTARWNNIIGNWISRDTVLFDVGKYASINPNPSGEYSFTGLENGTYQISWSIVYGSAANGNISGNVVSNTATSDYTEDHADPSLKVTTETTSRVIAAGTETTIAFSYTSTSANVSVAVQKQDGLCKFNAVNKEVTVTTETGETAANSQVKVVFGKAAESGTYRICFSSDENSSNDNVYFTFIIK